MNVAGVRAALRIARRDAVRAKGRSVLVIAMIGLPMLGLAFADVAIRTGQLPPAEQATRELGGADLVAEVVHEGPIVQNGPWDYQPTGGAEAKGSYSPERIPEPDVAAALPPGSRVVPRRTSYVVALAAADRVTNGRVLQIDLGDPTARGLVRLRTGALPRAHGEGAVTKDVARILGVGVGDTVALRESGIAFRVSGIVVEPSSLGELAAYLPPDDALPAELGLPEATARRWAVALPRGVRDLDVVPALNAIGLRVQTRSWIFDPPPDPYRSAIATVEAVGVAVVVVGLATLEIVLLAGTAFAVGARRRRRELALIAATGGDRRDVRRVVLAGGVVLGAVAGAFGVAGGIVGVVLLRPVLERLTGALLGPLDIRPLELGAIVAIGAGTALLATLLPARAASRQSVVGALTGRRGEARTRRRVPVVALVAIAVGAPLAFWAAGDGRVPAAYLDNAPVRAGRPANFNLLLAGAVLAELGFVACAPTLVGLLGRLAGRLPLSLRLAARDAARHRTRSGPAVAAVVAAVAGSVAVSVYMSSDTERQRREYQARMPAGAVWIHDGAEFGPDDRDVAAAAAALPVREVIDVADVAAPCTDGDGYCGGWALELPSKYECSDAPGLLCRRDGPVGSQLAVAEPALATWLARSPDGLADTMRAGRAVVFDARWLQDGNVVLRSDRFDQSDTLAETRRVTVPAVVAEPVGSFTSTPGLVMTPETARRYDLPTMRSATVVTTTRMPTRREESAALGALSRSASIPDLYVERGFQPENTLALLALVVGAGVVTVGATGIATGLAAADSRPDLATLAAVGAAPRVRRRLAMAQAATVAALGSALGILAGLVPSIAVVAARAEFPLAMPWTALATIAVGVPVAAALLIGAVTRSRLPLERRVA